MAPHPPYFEVLGGYPPFWSFPQSDDIIIVYDTFLNIFCFRVKVKNLVWHPFFWNQK